MPSNYSSVMDNDGRDYIAEFRDKIEIQEDYQMPDLKTYIINDQATKEDALDFLPYVETLADIIQTGDTPLTVGIFGTWGTGKTSLMKMIKEGVQESEYNGLPENYTVTWFDAWKYDKEETLWRSFLLCVLSAIRETAIKNDDNHEELDRLETMLYRAIDIEKVGGVKIDLLKLGGIFAKGTMQLGLSFIPGGPLLSKLSEEIQKLGAKALTNDVTEAIQRERTKIHIDQILFLEQFQNKFRKLVKTHITEKGGRLIVFVDDLDRCLAEKSIQVLEAIKLFLDVEDCVFVLGLDQEVIARAIEVKYKESVEKQENEKQENENQRKFTIEGVRYLEKIIQLPFQIPPIESTDMSDFVKKLSSDWPHEDCPKVFSIGLGNNPRQIKRTVNVFLMLSKLADRRKKKLEDRIKPIRLAKVVAIQTVYPELYNSLLKDDPRYLRELEEYFRSEANYKEENDIQTNLSQRPDPPPALRPFISKRGIAAVRQILLLHKIEFENANFAGLPSDELKLYFTLTARADIQQIIPTEESHLVFEPQTIKIPSGNFLMGTTKEQAQEILTTNNSSHWQQMLEWEQPQHTVELNEYFISKYPITNREYQAFIKEAKYKPPTNWDGDQFPTEKGGHPVVNISWDDAIEYCKWLGTQTKKQYRLPTEAEWEKSARWNTSEEKSLIYPWGNDFDPKKANSIEINSRSTSEVGQFSPQGDSPYGCVDMGGNVWEWCNDWFNEQEYKQHQDGEKNPQGIQTGSSRILRGGSWGNDRWPIRCARRNMNPPGSFSDYIGFRVVHS